MGNIKLIRWNNGEIEYLKSNYGNLDIKELKKHLHRSEKSIRDLV